MAEEQVPRELGEVVRNPGPAQQRGAGPTHWPSTSGGQAAGTWRELRDWVEQLVDRFNLDPRIVPPCWYRHNAMVEALLALRDHERASFTPAAPATGAVDWLRALHDVQNHLAACAARTQCSAAEHRDDQPRLWRTEETDFAAFLTADVAGRDS